jgi:hypothetical protein
MNRIAIAWVVVLAGCAQTVIDNAIRTCQPLCGCAVSPLPSAQQDCNASCEMAFERTPLPELCIQCITAHADRCATLFDDCDTACSTNVQLSSYTRATGDGQ